MRIESIEVIAVRLPLRSPWHTAAGTLNGREVLLVRLRSDIGDGWGECAAFAEPGYSAEFVASARIVLRDHLIPRLLAPTDIAASEAATIMSPVNGHRMAKSALEMAMLDAELRAAGTSFGDFLGVTRTHVSAGVAIGFAGSPAELCDRVAAYVDEGYRRAKLKIAPGRDLDYIASVRDQFPALALQVDANGAYDRDDLDHLANLDEFGLLLVEQPFGEDDLVGHARLAERLVTPVCLDEPIVSIDTTRTAVALGACDVVNPAANSAEGTPIYGMPILEADSARHVIVCNMDTRPGYSGVDNPLYTRSNTCLLMGDAVNTLQKMLDNLAAMHT